MGLDGLAPFTSSSIPQSRIISMIGGNYRSTLLQFIPITPSDQPHADQLIEKKNRDNYTDINQVRGRSVSHIEKMTHPLAQPDEADHLSPYMIDLLGKTTTLSFAEKVLQAPRTRLLDKLGIDDSQKTHRQKRLHDDQIAISRFYDRSEGPQPKSLTLNGFPYLEQEPTTPYFKDQKIITPDFRLFRRDEGSYVLDLLRSKLRDDSGIAFDQAPIEKLREYNDSVCSNEALWRDSGIANKADYFIEMTEYLSQSAEPGDFIVQNALESSSDKTVPHFQFIPNQVALPIFFHSPQDLENLDATIVPWHLPSLYLKFDLHQPQWRDKITRLQVACQKISSSHHISTTPIFRMLDHGQIEAYLLLKKDCSSVWNMTSEEIQLTPGWLEACGIFITSTPKAEVFNQKGALEYYAAYSVPADFIGDWFWQLLGDSPAQL